jgi:hypothetical protein
VKTLINDSITLEMESGDTMYDMKAKMQHKESIHP